MAKEKTETKQESKTKYFTNANYSALTIVKKNGERVTFRPFFEMWRGEKRRVGVLETEDKEIIDRCNVSSSCVEVTEKEYNSIIKGTPAFTNKQV